MSDPSYLASRLPAGRMSQQGLPYVRHKQQLPVLSFHQLNDPSRSSATLDAFRLETRPRPIEVDLTSSSSRSVALMPPPAPNFEPYSDPQFIGHNRSAVHSAEGSIRVPILEWWNSSNDAPWDPVNKTGVAQSEDARSRRGPVGPRPQGRVNLTNFRGTAAVASECGTLPALPPSDSGYESRTRPSVGNPSVYSDHDRSAEADFQAGGMTPDGVQGHRARLSQEGWSQPAVADRIGPAATNTKRGRFICPHCYAPVRTKSELNKHDRRHTKPFRCTELNCRRTEGFATQNDLDRHKRSCHPYSNANGARYHCTLGACKNKGKIWPRADNFKSHLKRVHHYEAQLDADLSVFVHREVSTCHPDLAGLGGPSVMYDFPPIVLSPGSILPSPGWLSDQRPDPDSTEERNLRSSSQLGYIGNANHFQDHADLVESPSFSVLSSPESRDSPAPPGSKVVQPSQPESARLRSQPAADKPVPGSSDPGDSEAEPEFLKESAVPKHTVEPRSEIIILDDEEPTVSPEGRGVKEPSPPPKEIPLGPSAGGDQAKDEVDIRHPPAASSTPPENGAEDARRSPEILEGEDDTELLETESSCSSDGDLDLDDERRASALIKSLQEKGTLDKLLGELGYQKAKTVAAKVRKPLAESQAGSDSCQFRCPTCPKAFHRKCELKKHVKRHEKPYGCTFPQCTKRFGSKNDWKRHENSQHIQLKTWKCNVPSEEEAGSECGNLYHRRKTFKNHLQKDHKVDAVGDRLATCLIDRNAEDRFWCGFCEGMVKIPDQRGLKALAARFNHIDDHFSGRNRPKMDISEWKNADPGLPVIDFTTPRSNGGSSPASSESSNPAPSVRPGEASAPTFSGKRKREDGDTSGQDSKKSRADRVDMMWYCCHCRGMNSFRTSQNCVMDNCNGHKQCGSCPLERPSGKEPAT